MNESLKVIEVLLVEDDPGDVVLIREAFEHNKVYNALHVVSDGVQALKFLQTSGGRGGRSLAGRDGRRKTRARAAR